MESSIRKTIARPVREFPNEIIGFSSRLNRTSDRPLNETDLERLFDEFWEIADKEPIPACLVLSKIMELGLVCAGRYADAGEFQAAGSLLVNPRHIDIYVKGSNRPIRKHRHSGLLSQLASLMGNENPVSWMKANALTRIRKKALLPCTYDTLRSSGLLKDDYLQFVDERMRKISEVIGFLSAWRIGSTEDLARKLQNATPQTREFIEENLCRFNLDTFHELDDDIRGIVRGDVRLRFLKAGVEEHHGAHFFMGCVISNMI